MFVCFLFYYSLDAVFLCPLLNPGVEWRVVKDFGSSLRQITGLERWDKWLLSGQVRGWVKTVIRQRSLQYLRIMSASGQKTQGWAQVRTENFLLLVVCMAQLSALNCLGLAVVPRCLWGIPGQVGFRFFLGFVNIGGCSCFYLLPSNLVPIPQCLP